MSFCLFPKFAKMLNLGNRYVGLDIVIYLEMRIARAGGEGFAEDTV